MSNSLQHTLGRVRPPRVQITYDVEIGNAIEKKLLPFVVGILSDLRGMAEEAPIPLKERKFIFIDRDNFQSVLKVLHPRLAFQVPNVVDQEDGEKDEEKDEEAEGSNLNIELFFQHMDDFHPDHLVKQVDPLKTLHKDRGHLVDLSSKLDGNDVLDQALFKVLTEDEVKAPLVAEIEAEDTPTLDTFIQDNNMIKDEEQLAGAKVMMKTFLTYLQKTEEPILDAFGFIQDALATIDHVLSRQLDVIMHHPAYQDLEGKWRGLFYLVMNTETSTTLKIRLLSLTRQEMLDDLEKAVEFDQSHLFKKIYEEEYGTFGGNPYSVLLCDMAFGRHPQDIELLRKLSGVAAAAHAPLLAGANPKLFDLNSFVDLSSPRDLAKIFESSELVKWNSFRETEDSRYVTLFLPRVLLRLPYGAATNPTQTFQYEETVEGEKNEKFCWGNPAYAMAQRITHAFSLYGWTAAIRGVEGGGLISNLPVFTFRTPRGDVTMKSPVEVVITDRREKELSDLGFITLCHCKGKDYAAFFGAQTTQKPKKYNLDTANANALISARLPYMLNASRFAHYVKMMIRDKIGSFMSRGEVEQYLQTWIADYVLLSDVAPQSVKAQYPLREAAIRVVDVPGEPGAYKAVMFLQPHFQLEELTTSIRLVAKLPA